MRAVTTKRFGFKPRHVCGGHGTRRRASPMPGAEAKMGWAPALRSRHRRKPPDQPTDNAFIEAFTGGCGPSA